jgi:hypothetical protein
MICRLSGTSVGFLVASIILTSTFASSAYAGWEKAQAVVAHPNDNGDADDKWADKAKASDGDPALYAVDKSNRSGWGAWLELQFGGAKGLLAGHLRINADWWTGAVDKVMIDIQYAEQTNWVTVHEGAVPNAVYKEDIVFVAGNVSKVRFRYHYTRSGYWFWLYELQLFEIVNPVVAPGGYTSCASNITKKSAVLHGMVTSDGGEPCHVRFEYGMTDALGKWTDWQTGFGDGETVAASASGLIEKQRCFYRMWVKNSAGDVACGNLNFLVCAEEEDDGTVWVSPVGSSTDSHAYDGASYKWEDTHNAHDDWDASAAQCYHMIHDPELWSPYLHLTPGIGLFNGLRFKAAKPDGYIDRIQIQIEKSSGWADVYDGPFAHDEWEIKSFAAYPIMNCRVRFHMSRAGVGANWSLYEFDFRKTGINLVVPNLDYMFEEHPGVIMGWTLGYLERLEVVCGPGIESLTSGIVKLELGPNTLLYRDTTERQELLARTFDLSNPEQRATFHDCLMNKILLVGGAEGSQRQGDGYVKLSVDYDGLPLGDEIHYTFAAVHLEQVPRFLFARAKYATTLKFRVEPAGMSGYSFGSVKASFTAGKNSRICDITERIIGVGDGGALLHVSQSIGNGGHAFEAYVPATVPETLENVPGIIVQQPFYNIDLPEGDSGTGRFTIRVRFRSGDFVPVSGEAVTASSQGTVEYFANLNVPAVDIPMSLDPGTKRPVPGTATINVSPEKRRWEAVKNIKKDGLLPLFNEVIEIYKADLLAEGAATIWHWPGDEVPMYEKRTEGLLGVEKEHGNIFQSATMKYSHLESRVNIIQRKDTLVIASHIMDPDNGKWKPVVCGKNYGKREGFWVCISYGGKDSSTDAVLGSVLRSGEAAMDYDSTAGTLEMFGFQGTANLQAVADKATDLSGEFGTAAKNIGSIFGEVAKVPFASEIIGLASALFSAIDKLDKSEVPRSAHAEFTVAWTRRDSLQPENDEVGIVIGNTLRAAPAYSGSFQGDKTLNVGVGNQCFIYADYATFAQQQAEGYWDLLFDAPKCFANIAVTNNDGFSPYYKLYERN